MSTTHTRTYKPTTTRDGRIITGKSERGRQVRSSDETVLYWAEGIYELESRSAYVNPTSIIAHGDKIFSYGTHFCMARFVRDAKGKVIRVLVNADTWSSAGWTTTGQHQGMVRSALNVHARDRGIEVLEIPFSVLDAAGIDHDSVRPLEIRESRHTQHEIESDTCPGSFAYVESNDPDDEDGLAYIGTANEGDTRERLTNVSTVAYERTGMAHASPASPARLGDDGIWRWTVERHWMGDSIIRAKSKETRQRRLTKDELELRDEWLAYSNAVTHMSNLHRESYVQDVGYDSSWLDCRDRLRLEAAELQSELPPATRLTGDDVSFSVTRWATYLSSFDYDEPHRPYFFCELPHGCKAETVDEGFAALMPMQISAHIGLGDKVLRQGDVYAVPTKFTTDELESMAATTEIGWWRYEDNEPHIGGQTYVQGKRDVKIRRRFSKDETYSSGELDIFGSNHQVTHLIVTKDGRYFGRGRMYHAPSNRPADHRVVNLEPNVWYEFIKNTVPTTKTRSGRVGVGLSVMQSGESRAWAVGGGVD